MIGWALLFSQLGMGLLYVLHGEIRDAYMTLEPAVEVYNLSKKYKIYAKPWHRALEWTSFGREIFSCRKLGRSRDLNFSVAPGECFGIIGRNGSGKSTLLKILAGAIEPTTGTYKMRGRVLALLELGAGFRPDLTGRQNVLTSSSLLGLPNGYAKSRMSEIEDFAELGEYFDRPIKDVFLGHVCPSGFFHLHVP